MNEIEIFQHPDFGNIRTTKIDDDPWFVGKDVAEALGYSNPLKAIRDHVDEEDKGVTVSFTPGGKQELIVINESGVYSLVFGSKLPEAKKFKRWVTSEVLPALRKTGGYQIPKEPMEALKLMFEIQTTDNERINAVESKVEDLTENAPLTSFEYNYLAQKVKQCVARAKVLFTSISTGQAGMLYRTVSTDLNKFAGVRFRNQIRKGQFEDVCEFLENWELSTADLAKIKRAGDVCDNA